MGPTRERASKGGEARASPPGSPPCGRLSAGGYRGGTVPCWRAREGRAPGTGEAPVLLAPTCSVVVPRGGGVSRRRRESLSLPAEAVACRPAGRSPRQGRLCRAPLSVLVPGMGVSVSVASRSLFSLPTLARGREGPGERRETGGRRRRETFARPAVRPAGAALGLRPQIRRGDPLNLSILVSGGKETNEDSLSNGERRGKSPAPNPRPAVGRGTCGVQKPSSPAALSGDPSPCDRGRSPRTV